MLSDDCRPLLFPNIVFGTSFNSTWILSISQSFVRLGVQSLTNADKGIATHSVQVQIWSYVS